MLSANFQASIIVVISSCTTRVNLPQTRDGRQLNYLTRQFVIKTELFHRFEYNFKRSFRIKKKQPRGVAITCNFFFRYAYMYFPVLTKDFGIFYYFFRCLQINSCYIINHKLQQCYCASRMQYMQYPFFPFCFVLLFFLCLLYTSPSPRDAQ